MAKSEHPTCYLIRSVVERSSYMSPTVITDVWVFVGKVTPVLELLDGAVGNKAGYGNPETAVRLEAFYRRLLLERVEEVYDRLSDYSPETASVTLQYRGFDPDNSWSGYDPRHIGYITDPKMLFGSDTYTSTSRGMRLLERIGKKVVAREKKVAEARGRHYYEEVDDHAFQNPVRVVEALEAMGAVRVEKYEGQEASRAGMTLVRATRPRERFRSEGLISIFRAER